MDGTMVPSYVTAVVGQRSMPGQVLAYSLKDDAMIKNDQQETWKAQRRRKTAEVQESLDKLIHELVVDHEEEAQEALDKLYNTACSTLDAVIAAVGKDSELGKQAAKIYSDFHGGSGSPPEET